MNAIPPHFDFRQVKDMKKNGEYEQNEAKGET